MLFCFNLTKYLNFITFKIPKFLELNRIFAAVLVLCRQMPSTFYKNWYTRDNYRNAYRESSTVNREPYKQ